MFRLFSQLTQDCELKCGKVIWVVGHSGPETAEDSRTHFGIFSPVVTQLFPQGQIINVHPWEPNEVAPCMAAALQTDASIVAVHLTRPAVQIPDRAALGMASHMEAAKGAYIVRAFDETRPREGTLIVQGTSTMDSMMELLPKFQSDKSMPNVKIVCATSYELFQLQTKEYKDAVLHKSEWLDSTVISNGSKIGMHHWLASKIAEDYAMTSDHDNRWRVGGSVTEVKKDAKIDATSLEAGIRKFATDRNKRLAALQV
jgi:transketolase